MRLNASWSTSVQGSFTVHCQHTIKSDHVCAVSQSVCVCQTCTRALASAPGRPIFLRGLRPSTQHAHHASQRDGGKGAEIRRRNRVVVGLPCSDTRRWQCFADSHAVMILFTHSVSQWQTALVSLWFQAESAFLSLQLWTSTERYPYGIADYGNPGTFHEPYAALHYTVGSVL